MIIKPVYEKLIIPGHCFPDVNYAVEKVYRLVKNSDNLGIEDFLPTKIEYDLRGRKKGQNLTKLEKLKNAHECENYSCSIYEDLERMIRESINNRVTRHKKMIVEGIVDFKKGMTTTPDKNSHINYFLHDYVNKNPYVDFVFLKNVEDYLNEKRKQG